MHDGVRLVARLARIAHFPDQREVISSVPYLAAIPRNQEDLALVAGGPAQGRVLAELVGPIGALRKSRRLLVAGTCWRNVWIGKEQTQISGRLSKTSAD